MISFFCLLSKPFSFGQEDERKREEKDERKRKYNVIWNDEVMFLFCYCLLTHNALGHWGDLFSLFDD